MPDHRPAQVLERMRRARRQAAAESIQAAWRRHRASAQRPPPPAPSAARPRPAPIAGTPPPDPADKCDPALVKRTCSLFGLDLVGSGLRQLHVASVSYI